MDLALLVVILAAAFLIALLTAPYPPWVSGVRGRLAFAKVAFTNVFFHAPMRAWRKWRCRRAYQYLLKYDRRFRTREFLFERNRRYIASRVSGTPGDDD